MNKLLFMVAVLAVSACGKKDTDLNAREKTAEPMAQTKVVGPATEAQLTPQQAHEYASAWAEKMSAYELVLNGAFERGEQAGVEQILSRLNKNPAWPEGDAMSPYTKCDTAWRDLILLANAQNILLKTPTDAMRKIVAQESGGYQKSKSLCTTRLKMTAEQAAKAEADEYKK